MNKIIKLKNISKNYHTKEGEINAIKDISFDINKGEFISIVGPSGCGKSTILSIIANIDKDYLGNIEKDNIKIAYMLQSDTLLPYLTIYDNTLLGLKITNNLNKETIEYVNYLLKYYNLWDFKDKYPDNLSGGMKQRVSLIRTLALKPDLLLLDEPFSALDEQSRLLISDDIYKYARNNNKTIILVTHNIEEAIYFSDRIVILSKRPSYIKKIINVNINNKESIYIRKNSKESLTIFDEIWKELDTLE
jgi:NitT/TauT family transport system ATP-binding protein